MAKAYKIKNYSSMRKAELMDSIAKVQQPDQVRIPELPSHIWKTIGEKTGQTAKFASLKTLRAVSKTLNQDLKTNVLHLNRYVQFHRGSSV